jgi:Helicase associated domain
LQESTPNTNIVIPFFFLPNNGTNHRDCNVPKEWSENKQLGAWVSTQRKMYKALLAGQRSSLTPERRSALDSIGFTWILRPARTRPGILEIEALQQQQQQTDNTPDHGGDAGTAMEPNNGMI